MRPFAWLLALASLAPALHAGPLDAPSQELLGARAAGMGGVQAPGSNDLESVIYDPAGLPTQGLQAGLFSAVDQGRSQAGLGLSLPVDQELRLGFFGGGLQAQGLQEMQARSLGLAAAADLQPGLTLGLRGQWHQLQAPALGDPVQGGSVDAGLQFNALQAPGVPGLWALSFSVDHLLGFWPAAWASALPMAGHASLAYRPSPRWTLGVQTDASSAGTEGEAADQVFRGGLQWQARPAFALRAGWSDDGRLGLASAGLGWDLARWNSALDYALLVPVGAGGAGLLQRLALRWSWDRPAADAQMQVRFTQVLREPDSGLVRNARLELSLSPELRVLPWHVELKDEQGQVWRTLTPSDPQALALTWDGRDEQGRLRPPPRGLRAELVAPGAGSLLRSPQSLPLEYSIRAQALQALQAPPLSGALPAPSFKPVFDDASGGELSHVLIDLPETPASAWSVEMDDSQGRRLRKMEGQGSLPRRLVWDGRDEQGEKVGDVLGTQVRLGVTDAQGQARASLQPLFDQAAFVLARREARQRPSLRLASLGLPLRLGRPALSWMQGFLPALSLQAHEHRALDEAARRRESAQGRLRRGTESLELDFFEPGSSALQAGHPELWKALDAYLKASSFTGSTLWITGLASRDERDSSRLGRRRAVALSRRLRGHGEGLALVLQAAQPGLTKGIRLSWRSGMDDGPAGVPVSAESDPEFLRARYRAEEEPEDLRPDQAIPREALPALQRWDLAPSRHEPMAWNAETGKLAFYRDGWVWVTDAQGSRLRSLWFEPDLAAAGQLAWSPSGQRLWLKADRWRHWFCLQMEAVTRV